MPSLIDDNDTPPGAPAYASGPLANPLPTAGAVLASGQSPDSYFQPKGIPVVQPAGTPALSGLGQVAQSLLSRATTGFASLFGGTTAPAVAAALVSGLANRTKALESGLNELELRSTGFRRTPNIVVANNSAADARNAAFTATQGPTAAEYNALPPAQRKALDNFNNLPSSEKDKQPSFYQKMIAGGK